MDEFAEERRNLCHIAALNRLYKCNIAAIGRANTTETTEMFEVPSLHTLARRALDNAWTQVCEDIRPDKRIRESCPTHMDHNGELSRVVKAKNVW